MSERFGVVAALGPFFKWLLERLGSRPGVRARGFARVTETEIIIEVTYERDATPPRR